MDGYHGIPKITIAICTFNRCQSLAVTLRSLAIQTEINWSSAEIIVVDNNCTDDTAGMVAAFTDRLPLRRVVETAQGLSHGRNRAVSEARGPWVLFTDDDVRLDRGWLAAYQAAFRRFPQASFASGRILPDWQGRPPVWFKGERLDLLDGVLGWYDLGPNCRLMNASDPEPFGASIAVRRDLLGRLGGFRTDLGICGTSFGRGEETELFGRARSAGETVVYVGNAVCWHLVDPRRLTLRSLYRYGRASGEAYRAIVDAGASGSPLAAAAFLARGLFQLGKGRGDRFRQCVINVGMQLALSSRQ